MIKLTRGQDITRELLNAAEAHVKARRDHSAIVDAPHQIHDDLAGPVVVKNLQIADVAILLHHWRMST